MYFLKGVLPWQNLKARNVKEKYIRIREKKLTTGVEELCEGFPEEFAQYCSYVRGLKFEDRPDYNYLRSLFKNLFKRLHFEFDYQYDWLLRKAQEKKSKKNKKNKKK